MRLPACSAAYSRCSLCALLSALHYGKGGQRGPIEQTDEGSLTGTIDPGCKDREARKVGDPPSLAWGRSLGRGRLRELREAATWPWPGVGLQSVLARAASALAGWPGFNSINAALAGRRSRIRPGATNSSCSGCSRRPDPPSELIGASRWGTITVASEWPSVGSQDSWSWDRQGEESRAILFYFLGK